MRAKIPRIMFAAFNSGSGKTTITCAVLKALMEAGITPAAFKCGPDYIDPMFHSQVIGVKSRNLDLFMLSAEVCKFLLASNSLNAKIAVLEGVMGYYDGLGGTSSTASSYHVAQVTNTPVILIVDCKGSSLSLAGLIKGFVQFRTDSRIEGVILNNLSPALYPLYQEMIEKETGIDVVGYFPKMKECSLESRHLGLITPAEILDLQDRVKILAEQAKKSIALERLIVIAENAPEIECPDYRIPQATAVRVRIAVAWDKAFSFYYQDSLDLLERMGAVIQYFSPLSDTSLPECEGFILGGGYPEIYAKELSENEPMLASIKKALESKMPCIAECGGFMVLLDQIRGKDGKAYPMIGFLSGHAYMTENLNRFGYITLTAQEDNLLFLKEDRINAHEFHYSDSTCNGKSCIAIKPVSGKQWECINARDHLFAGYPHFHFWGNMNAAKRFLEKCQQYKAKGNELPGR